jgi:hypothetical protein
MAIIKQTHCPRCQEALVPAGFLGRTKEGVWVHARCIFRESGMITRYKTVPPPKGIEHDASNTRGRSPVVHHESEVLPLLGIGAQPEAPNVTIQADAIDDQPKAKSKGGRAGWGKET